MKEMRKQKLKRTPKIKPNSDQGHGGRVGWLGTQQSAHRNLTPVHSGQSCEQCAGVKVCNIIFSIGLLFENFVFVELRNFLACIALY